MATVLDRHFKRMGARVKVHKPNDRWERETREDTTLGLDVRRDEFGEFFDFTIGKDAKAVLEVLNVAAEDRHLLLLVKRPDEKGKQMKQRFLCGHDERHWFVAAIPEEFPVSTVDAAKTALKPEEVRTREKMAKLPASKRHTRSNEAFKRQGEWFFIPAWSLKPDRKNILKNEPFNRGRGKFHYAQEALQQGGSEVYTFGGTILSPAEYHKLPAHRKSEPWRRMMADADMYVRGKITHADHATLILEGWHKVLMNLESRARAMQSVRFLD